MSTTELKFVPYVPKGFTGAPADVVDALKRGRAVLVEEEDRWVRSAWFENHHPEVNIQDPFCNNWRVCAEGAVLIVTVGLHNRSLISYIDEVGEVDDPENVACPWGIFDEVVSEDYGAPEDQEDLFELADPVQRDLYQDAVDQLRDTGQAIYLNQQGHHAEFDWAHQFNDAYFTTRDEVVAWFDKAIEDAQR